MAFTPVPNNARFELVYTHNGIVCENVFHVQDATSSWTSAELIDEASKFKDWWDTNIKPLVSSSTILTKIIGTSLYAQTSPKVEYVTGLPIVGTGVGTPLPGNVTVAIKWTTGNRGRSARGRTFHVGLCESQVTGNLIDESFYTSLLNAYAQLSPTVESGIRSLRVVSLWHNKVKREEGSALPIIGWAIESTVDTQRRRLV